jgi:hypothetical protein
MKSLREYDKRSSWSPGGDSSLLVTSQGRFTCTHAAPLPCSDRTVSFVKVRVVAGRNRTRAGSPQAVSRRPCCAVALRRTTLSEPDMGAAWQVWIRHGPALCKSNGTHSKLLAARHGRGAACYVWIGLQTALCYTHSRHSSPFSAAETCNPVLNQWTLLYLKHFYEPE